MKHTTVGPKAFFATALSWTTAALVLVPTLFLSTPQTAEALTTPRDGLTGAVSKGLIETSAGNPILKVDTNFASSLNPQAIQIYAPEPLGHAFTVRDGSVSSRVVVLSGTTTVEKLQHSSDAFGGSGTVADPFWLSKTMKGENFTVAKKDSYTLGAGYLQTDLTVTNDTDTSKETSVGFFADCLMAGEDLGYSSVTPGLMATCQNETDGGDQMSIVAGSPGATVEAGYFATVGKDTNVAQPLNDKCVTDSSSPANDPAGSSTCGIYQDNGFAIKFNPTIPAGESSTHTYFTTYGETISVSDLVFYLEQSRDVISQGENVTYTLSLTNEGPAEAKVTQAAFALPSGMQFESAAGDGSYDADTGSWSIGDVSPGESRAITVTARALTVGTFVSGITNGTSSSLDLSACSPGALENCGPRVTLEATGLTNSTIEAAPASVRADGVSTSTVTVTLRDINGRVVTNASHVEVALLPSIGTVGPVEDNEDGTYSAKISSTDAGAGEVAFSVDGELAPATAPIVFVAGAVSEDRSSLTLSEGEKLADGIEQHTAVVSLRDEHENPLTGLAGDISLIATPATGLVLGEFSETGPGNYSATIASTLSGSFALHGFVKVDGLLTQIGAGAVAFAAGTVDMTHENTSFTVSQGVQPIDTGHHTITVTLSDGTGSPVSDRAEDLDASATLGVLGEGEVSRFTESSTAGQYVATVNSTFVGAFPLTVTLSGETIVMLLGGNESAVFGPGDVDLEQQGTQFSVSEGMMPVDAGSHTLTVELVDRFGHSVSGAEAELSGKTVQPLVGVVSGFVETADPGVYTASISSEAVGFHQIVVAFRGDTISPALGANEIARFVAGSVGSGNPGTGFTVSLGEHVVGEAPHTLTVRLTDVYGNLATGQAQALDASITGSGVVGAFFESETDPGVYSASISSTRSGDMKIAVDFKDASIFLLQDGNDCARFSAGEVDLTHERTTFTVSEGGQDVGGGLHFVSLTLVDAHGNGVPGKDVQLAGSASALGMGFVSGFVDMGAGTYQATVASTVAGSKPVTVTYASSPVTAPVETNTNALFLPGDVDVDHEGTGFVVTEGNRVAGKGTHVVSVTLVDEFGNPVGGQAAALVWDTADSLGTASVGAVVETDVSGTYQAEISATVRGQKAIEVFVGKQLVAPSGNDIARFISDEIPDYPEVDPSDGNSITGCSLPGSMVAVYDKDGNVLGTGIAGADCRFEIAFVPPLEEGTDVTVNATDEDGNESAQTPLRIGLIHIVLDHEVRTVDQRQVATGANFQPGERVTGTLRSKPVDLGALVADADGRVVFEFALPEGISLGAHRVILTGERSGSVEASFRVVRTEGITGFWEAPIVPGLAATGGQVAPFAGALFVLILGSGFVLAAAKQRRRTMRASTLASGEVSTLGRS